jgi:hypothetical protein
MKNKKRIKENYSSIRLKEKGFTDLAKLSFYRKHYHQTKEPFIINMKTFSRL